MRLKQTQRGVGEIIQYRKTGYNGRSFGKKKYSPTEAQIQAALFEWAAYNLIKYPELKLLHAIPNGGSRHPAEAANLRRQGVKPGVSDIFLPVARRLYHGIYIELKAAKGRLRPMQKEWLTAVSKEGYYATMCRGTDEAIALLTWYLAASNDEEAIVKRG